MTVHLFNPENDTALAADVTRYTPPAAARTLHIDGALLPRLWADADDIVLTRHRKLTLEEAAQVTSCNPWGWSMDARRQFLEAGVPEAILPSPTHLNRLRELSHRRQTVRVMRYLADNLDSAFADLIPCEVTEVADIANGDCYVKLPWSSSGRGVFRFNPQNTKSIEGAIRRQGSVMVERELEKVADFAALFKIDAGRADYKGLSIFTTDATGAYTGNLVAVEVDLRKRLAQLIELRKFDELVPPLAEIITTIYGKDYEGWLGVDMMVYRDSKGRHHIAPCIEVNMRMTMGVVAWYLARNEHFTEYLTGIFEVRPWKPLAGELNLSPVSHETRFCFTLRKL